MPHTCYWRGAKSWIPTIDCIWFYRLYFVVLEFFRVYVLAINTWFWICNCEILLCRQKKIKNKNIIKVTTKKLLKKLLEFKKSIRKKITLVSLATFNKRYIQNLRCLRNQHFDDFMAGTFLLSKFVFSTFWGIVNHFSFYSYIFENIIKWFSIYSILLIINFSFYLIRVEMDVCVRQCSQLFTIKND